MLEEDTCNDSDSATAAATSFFFSVDGHEEGTPRKYTEASLDSSNNDEDQNDRSSTHAEDQNDRSSTHAEALLSTSECVNANDLFQPDRCNSLMAVIRRGNLAMVCIFTRSYL